MMGHFPDGTSSANIVAEERRTHGLFIDSVRGAITAG